MKHTFWSKLLFALTMLGALLTFAGWLGRQGRGILLALAAGLFVQAVPVYLIWVFARSQNRRRALKGIAASGGRITARLAANPHCILAVDLSNAALENLDWESLSALVHLESLNMSHTSLTEDRLEDLSRLSALQDLNLDGTLIGDKGLALLRDFPHLETVSLTDTPVTADGIEDLLRSRPKLQVRAGHMFGSTELHSIQDVCHDSVV